MPRLRNTVISSLLACTALLAWGDAPRPDTAPAPGTLTDLVRQALSHAPQVRSARAQWQATQAQLRQVHSRWWPSAGLNAQAGQADVTDLNRELNRRTERAEAYLRLNVFNGGADQALLKATEHDHEAAKLDLTQALQDVAEKTAQAFFEVQRQQFQVQQATARLRDVERLSADVDRLVQHGKSPESDRHVAQASLADAQSAYETARLDEALAHRRLQTLVGAPIPPLQPFELPAMALNDAVDAPVDRSAANNNPAWLASQARATSARVKLGPIQPELMPKIDLEWRQLLSERTTPTPSSGQQRGWSLSVAYDVPLGGASFARRAEGLARAAAADGEADRIAQAIELDFDMARQNLHRSAKLTPIYQRQARHLEAVVAASTLQYEAGRRDLIDLINLREAPYTVQQKLADNELQRQSAALRFWALTGQLLPVLGLSSWLPSD